MKTCYRQILLSWVVSAVIVISGVKPAPAQNALPQSIAELKHILTGFAAFSSSTQKSDSLNALLDRLKAKTQIPFTTKDSVLFLVRASSGTVQIFGDHCGWSNETGVPFSAVKFPGLDVYTLALKLPSHAKSDYKVVLGSSWILDPLNSRQQWGGFGPNSTFWMPDYEVTTEMNPRSGIQKGSVTTNIRYNSTLLGYAVNYRVYTPPGYTNGSGHPVIYFTDGHEYADQNLGAVPTIIDNLVADGKIPPVMAVFIDPRNPSTGANRRNSELIKNAAFSDFIATELVPFIDRNYKTAAVRTGRAIGGTSLGGFHSAWISARHPGVFGNVLIHSPAFHVDRTIIETWRTGSFPVKTFLSYGTLFDGTADARTFRDMLASSSYDFRSIERAEGHSWGQWRTLIDEPMVYFFSNFSTQTELHPEFPELTIKAYPNPFNPAVNLSVFSETPVKASWNISDLTGRIILNSGIETFVITGITDSRIDMSGYASGVYIFNLVTEMGVFSRKLALVR
jgi:enterochelin esterase family protein